MGKGGISGLAGQLEEGVVRLEGLLTYEIMSLKLTLPLCSFLHTELS